MDVLCLQKDLPPSLDEFVIPRETLFNCLEKKLGWSDSFVKENTF